METVSSELYSRLIREARQKGEIASEVDDRMAAFCMDNLFMAHRQFVSSFIPSNKNAAIYDRNYGVFK